MSHNLQRSTHFNSELAAIQRDEQKGQYGFRNTFDEWETRKARAADDDDSEDPLCDEARTDKFVPPPDGWEEEYGGEDEIERLRSRGGSFGVEVRRVA